ncbi:MAG: cyclic nucleotide-binding domain-containing protein [Deltaproteobacteria bacterium]|nr:cyclic nucleotide-binding domain-containing protein [Deltaproteobacteria bacterium]
MMEKDISLLKEITLFKDLPMEKIRKIVNILRRVTFAESEIIMKEGDSGDTMYIILEGSVEVVKSLVIGDMDDEDVGKNKVFTRLDGKQHAVFGEIALLEELRRTATIKAITNCVLYEIKKDDFLKLAEEDYELGYRILLNIARVVSARLRKADEETVKLTTALSIILQET